MAFALGVLPGVTLLAWIQRTLYGSPFSSGYGPLDQLFSWSHILPNLQRYPAWLVATHTPVVCLALAAPFVLLARARRPDALDRQREASWLAFLSLAVAGAVVAAYLVYIPYDDWWYLRFLLPAMPAVLIGALLVARQLQESALRRWGMRRVGRVLVAGLLVGATLWAASSSRHWIRFFRVSRLAAGDAEYPRGVAWMARQVPPDAAVACFQTSGAVYAYSRFPVIRYDILDPASAARLGAELRASRTPVFALLFEVEEPDFRARYGDAFVEHGRSGRSSLWRLRE
jgi:hypothetical protein